MYQDSCLMLRHMRIWATGERPSDLQVQPTTEMPEHVISYDVLSFWGGMPGVPCSGSRHPNMLVLVGWNQDESTWNQPRFSKHFLPLTNPIPLVPSGKRLRNWWENHNFSWENSRFLWWFSIVMLVYQRVCWILNLSQNDEWSNPSNWGKVSINRVELISASHGNLALFENWKRGKPEIKLWVYHHLSIGNACFEGNHHFGRNHTN